MNAKLRRPLLKSAGSCWSRAGLLSIARLSRNGLAFVALFAMMGNGQTLAAETASTTSEPDSVPAAVPAENLPADSATKATSLEAFKIVVERNIFNANRRALPAAPPPAEPPKRIDSISLAGTLLDDQTGHYAFFSGSDASFNRVLQPGESIAGLKIVSIQIDTVKLEAESAPPLDLPMGMQLRRENDGPWQVIAGGGSSSSRSAMSRTDDDRGRSDSDSRSGRRERGSDTEFGGRTSRRERGSSSESGNPNTAAGARPSEETGGGSTDEILKRLMQQRQQELNRR